VVKISPEWVTGPEQVKSSGRTATFSHWTGMFRDDISHFIWFPRQLISVSKISSWQVH
jgi:hypothetical protein